MKAIKPKPTNFSWRKLCLDVVHDSIGFMTEPKKLWKFAYVVKNMGGKGFQKQDLGEIRELVCTTPEELINSRWIDGDECFWTSVCLPTTSFISFVFATPERARGTPPLPPPSQPMQCEDKDKDLYDVHSCLMNNKQSPCCRVNKLTCCVYVCPLRCFVSSSSSPKCSVRRISCARLVLKCIVYVYIGMSNISYKMNDVVSFLSFITLLSNYCIGCLSLIIGETSLHDFFPCLLLIDYLFCKTSSQY